jgi:hypothetical protein
MMRMHRVAAVIIAFLCLAADAGAHTRSESYSHWYQSDTTITGTITIPLREVMLDSCALKCNLTAVPKHLPQFITVRYSIRHRHMCITRSCTGTAFDPRL